MSNKLNVSTVNKYKLMSDQYHITGSNKVLERILETFPIQTVMDLEEDFGILYQLMKREPEYVKLANRMYNKTEFGTETTTRLSELFMDFLKEEYENNVKLTETVIETITGLDLLDTESNLFRDVFELSEIAIKHMKSQGFEKVAYTLNHSDIRKMICCMLQPLEFATMEENMNTITSILTKDNFQYIIEGLDIVLESNTHDKYGMYIHTVESALNMIKSLPEDIVDENAEDYNPLDDDSMTNDDRYQSGLNYINCDVSMLDREEFYDAINTISRLMDLRANTEDNDTFILICYRMLRNLYRGMRKTYDSITADSPKPANVLRDIEDIPDFEFRMPRLAYLTDGEFEILSPAYHINLAPEYGVAKYLNNIQHIYDEWYDAKLANSIDYNVDRFIFTFNLNNIALLLPFEEEDKYNIFV